MTEAILAAARRAVGFMPEAEGLALYRAGLDAGRRGPLLEIGGYGGQSAIYLGSAAREVGTVLFSIDHHRGSEENQPGEEYHDPDSVDPRSGRVDTLPLFRRAIEEAGLEQVVIAVVGGSTTVAAHWATPLGLVLIDGGHSSAAAEADYDAWSAHVTPGGLLAIHDVFPDPADGGRPPYEVYLRALASGRFSEEPATGSLRVLRRAAP